MVTIDLATIAGTVVTILGTAGVGISFLYLAKKLATKYGKKYAIAW